MKLPISNRKQPLDCEALLLLAEFNCALAILFREIQRILPLCSPRQKKPSDFSNFSIRIYLESRISRCISERPLACYVMALSRQTARTFPGHRTSINYRSFHERLKITRVYQIQATSSGKMEIANHGKRIGSADRSAEISLRK